MRPKADYPFEFMKPLELCLNMLSQCNVTFFENNTAPLKKFWRYFLILICMVSYYVTLTTAVVNTLMETTEVVVLAYMLPIYMIVVQAILKIMILIPNKKEIHRIINHLGHMWRTDRLTKIQTAKKNMLLRRLEIFQKVFYYTSMLGSWLYTLTPLTEILFRRFLLQQESQLVLPYPSTYPFNPAYNWGLYTAMYILQSFSMFKFIYAYLGTEFLIVALCSHILTEFTLLREDLLHLHKDNSKMAEDCSDSDIRKIVRKHQELIELCNKMDLIFNKINFIILLFATVITCFFAFAAKVTHGLVFMLVNYLAVLGMLVPLFILCYYSELLTNASAGIANSAYDNLWYDRGKRYQKSILLIIMRSQTPCCLTSLRYTPISLNTFSKVLSTTWSYFSLIVRLHEEGY